jgi:hypothetical protein
MSDKAAEKKAAEEKALEDRIMAKVQNVLDEKDKEIEILKEQLANPYIPAEGDGNPKTMLYKGKKHRQFDEADVKGALKDGWSEEPDVEPKEPNPAPGEIVKGKPHKG